MGVKDLMIQDMAVEGGGRRLAVRLPPGCTVMDYQVDMIKSNRIDGLLPFQAITSDGRPCFFYDIDGLVPLSKYIEANGLDLRSAVEILLCVASTAGSLDTFLLSEPCLLIEYGHVYIDADRKAARLAYIPVDQLEMGRGRFTAFALDVIGKTRAEQSTEKLFCRKVIDELKKSGFRYDGFCYFLMDVLCFSGERHGAGFGALGGADGAGCAGGAGAAGVADASSGAAGLPMAATARGGGKGARQDAKPRRQKGAAMAPAAMAPGGLRLPALVAAGIAVAYFVALTFMPPGGVGAAQNAALLAAVGAELFALSRFFPKGSLRVNAQGKDAAAGGGSFARAVGEAAGVHSRASLFDGQGALQNAGASAGFDLWAQSVEAAEAGQGAFATKAEAVGAEAGPASVEIAAADVGVDSVEMAVAESVHTSTEAKTPVEAPSAASFSKPLAGVAAAGAACDRNMPAPPEMAGAEAGQAGWRDELVAGEETQILASSMAVEAMLYIRGDTRECGIALKGKPFVIGRRKDRSDLVFDNLAVGKTHAMIERDGGSWLLTDLDSKNGTYVNNIRLDPGIARPIRNYDLITVANVDMVFIVL